MKSLNDIKQDMSDIYEAVKSGSTDLKTAAELTNIAGKFLKADALQFAREMYLERNNPAGMKTITDDSKVIEHH